VFIDDVIDRNGRVYFRCHVEETLHHRALEIPDWMLQETCSTTGLVETPVVNCSALRNLKALLDGASSHDLGLTEAQCFEGGADATDTGSKAVSMPTVSATIDTPTFATMPLEVKQKTIELMSRLLRQHWERRCVNQVKEDGHE